MLLVGKIIAIVSLVTLFIVSIISIFGLLRIEKVKLVQCPNCIEKIPVEVIICRYCGQNVNSLGLANPSFMRTLKDKIDNMDEKTIRFIPILLIFIGLFVYYIVNFVF